MKFNKILEQLISTEYAYQPKNIDFEKYAKNLKNTGFTDITSFAMFSADAIDTSNLGTNVLGHNSKGVKNDGSSRMK